MTTTIVHKFLIVDPASAGPKVYTFESLEMMVITLMAWASYGVANNTKQTAWKKKGGRWVPMAPWLHGREAA